MSSKNESESESENLSTEQMGGRHRKKKNVTAKKHKKGNKILAAWRDHVQEVAKEEGMSYGKDAMKMAKKGKYGKQWAHMKASLKGGADSNEQVEQVADEVLNDEGNNKDEVEIIEAEKLNEGDGELKDAGEAVMLGGKRRKSRKNNKRNGKKSRKQRRSRKM